MGEDRRNGKKTVVYWILFLMLIVTGVGCAGISVVKYQQNQKEMEECRQLEKEYTTLKNEFETEQEKFQQAQQAAKEQEDEEISKSDAKADAPAEDTNTKSASIWREENQTEGHMLPGIENILQENLGGISGNSAAYVIDLTTQAYGVFNDSPMQAASLIKLYIMGAVYENYDASAAYMGDTSRLDTLLSQMITISDNDAANTLTEALGSGDSTKGMEIVNEFCSTNGYDQTSMGRLLLASAENGDNYTSVSDCGMFLKDVYENRLPYAQNMLQLLKDQTRTSKIPSGVPEGVETANKTGELADVENDAAIVFTPQGDYILCVMVSDTADPGAAVQAISQTSREVYGYFHP